MEEKIKVLWLGINAAYLMKSGVSNGFVDARLSKEKPDLVIVVDWTPNDRATLREMRQSGIPSILLAQEPSVVIPKHLSHRLSRFFDYTITVGRPGGDAWIYWPQSWQPEHATVNQRLNRGVVINADKYSAVSGELYSLRRTLVSKDERIDLFGNGWNDPTFLKIRRWISALGFTILNRGKLKLRSARRLTKRPLHYFGPTENKHTTLKKYKYSVVIENSREYMSEKLFDCFFAGTIPIYVGPDLEKFDIPKKLVIEAKPDITSIQAGIASAAKMDLIQYHIDLDEWLSKPKIEASWSEHFVIKDLFSKIRLWYQEL